MASVKDVRTLKKIYKDKIEIEYNRTIRDLKKKQ